MYTIKPNQFVISLLSYKKYGIWSISLTAGALNPNFEI